MYRVPLLELIPCAKTAHALHDVRTGRELVGKATPLNYRIIQALRTLPDQLLIAVENPDEAGRLRRATNFEKLEVDSILSGVPVTSDVYSPDGRLLLAGGTVLSESFLNNLKRRNITMLWVRKRQASDYIDSLQFIANLVKEEQDKLGRRFQLLEQTGGLVSCADEVSLEHVIRLVRLHTAQGTTVVQADGEHALINRIQIVDSLKPRPEHRKAGFLEMYRYLLSETAHVFGKLSMLQEVDHREVATMCNEIIEALVEDRHMLLAAAFMEDQETQDYLFRHSLNVAILSVNIAATHGYSHAKVMEIGHGALLADVGMLCVPDEIRFKPMPLDAPEVLQMQKHPQHGVDRLRCVTELPQTTPIVAYQAHERLDGSGYPDGKKSHAIHDYAKLVAVADVFHALIDPRPYRKRAILPYRAMEEMLHLASSGKLERKFVRALLDTLSLFPVGTWVRLSTGEIAQVLSAHQSDHTRPVVSVMYDPEGVPCPPKRLDLRFWPGLKVEKAERVSVAEPLAGF